MVMVESSDSTEQFREINISGGSTNYFGELAFYLCMVLLIIVYVCILLLVLKKLSSGIYACMYI